CVSHLWTCYRYVDHRYLHASPTRRSSDLRRVARREILHMARRRDHGARNAEPLGDMALHLRAEHELRPQLADAGFDLQVIVGNQRLDAVDGRSLADLAGEFAGIGAETDDLEAELLGRDARRGDRMSRVAEDEDALAGEIGRVDRARIPWQSALAARQDRRCIDTG